MIEEIRKAFVESQRILVVSHIRPDGDAVGSLLGLGLPLRETGKDVVLLLSDGVPESLRFLPQSSTVVTHASGEFDLIVSVDASEPERLGPALRDYGMPDINIDHHITNTRFGRINFVETDSPATAQMIADRLDEFGLPWSAAAAQCLLTGMLTDTLGFRVQSVTPQTLRTAASLMEMGADLPGAYKQALLQRTVQAARYWGAGLSTLHFEGKIISSVLTLSARTEAGYPGSDDADLVNVLSGIKDAPVAVLFIEQADASHPEGPRVKVSWRSQDGTDVSKVAMLFGGGGHRAAAGAEISGEINKVRKNVLKATAAAIAEPVA